mmetsp:Transcript_35953/g.114288  ORF Transcript_35953/g.114288 Transcript_35953/m.114288 type:complete len:240 (-) Transcript_35953:88-807(-)
MVAAPQGKRSPPSRGVSRSPAPLPPQHGGRWCWASPMATSAPLALTRSVVPCCCSKTGLVGCPRMARARTWRTLRRPRRPRPRRPSPRRPRRARACLRAGPHATSARPPSRRLRRHSAVAAECSGTAPWASGRMSAGNGARGPSSPLLRTASWSRRRATRVRTKRRRRRRERMAWSGRRGQNRSRRLTSKLLWWWAATVRGSCPPSWRRPRLSRSCRGLATGCCSSSGAMLPPGCSHAR